MDNSAGAAQGESRCREGRAPALGYEINSAGQGMVRGIARAMCKIERLGRESNSPSDLRRWEPVPYRAECRHRTARLWAISF